MSSPQRRFKVSNQITAINHIIYGFKEYWLVTYGNGLTKEFWYYTREMEDFERSRDSRH